ncbi:TPA: DUF6453 family protein [Escherichia coli]
MTINITNANLNIGDIYCQIVFTGTQSRRVDGYFNVRKKAL